MTKTYVSHQPSVVVEDADLRNVLSSSCTYEERHRALLRIVAHSWGQGWEACIAEFANRLESLAPEPPVKEPPHG